ncbi:sensor histidine kinase [[Clostridium] fimetarium]|uniref:histidine kinase n=1 Tax=[Clostridium] fimetarium TaxID=99656 RepID=A0A1I0MV97_9FIRM|nr:sensor histidine kinase [[Clostridium] fimetarium]SEV92303.1 two-component system, sensor histidine kinase YesM [[Clostridium] fimetarium]
MKNTKLKYKLGLIYLVTSILPIMVLFSFSYFQIKKMLMEKDTKTIQTFLYQSTEVVDNQIQIYDNLSNYISFNETISRIVSYDYKSNYEMYNQFVNIMDPMLASLKYFHNDVNKVTIYTDKDIKHDETIAPISEISGKWWFNDACNKSDLEWYADNDSKILFSARKMPMLDKSNMLGILYIGVDYNKVFDTYTQNIDDNYGVFVTDENGNVIYEYSKFQDEFQDMQLDYGQLANTGNNSKYLIINEKSDSTNWTAWMYKPKSLVIQSVQPMMTMMLVTFILSISAATMAILSLSKLVTKRIGKLKDNMKEVEKGNFVIWVKKGQNDEIGELIDGFGNMIVRIQNLISEVYEAKINQKEYEMRALRAQINPHFLYNSLSLINWKALELGENDISQITLALSNYYRTSLNKGGNTLSLEMELSNVKSYLQIQSMMHDNNFDIEINVEEQILQCETLNLLLQPLVENAINHGIDLKLEGRGKITITGKLQDGLVYLKIEDNGVGMDQETLKNYLNQNSSGYGAKNVNQRIILYYGEAYEMKVESGVNQGTQITIVFPARKYQG